MGKTSQYKGVYFDEKSRRWRAFLYGDGKSQFFGAYPTEEKAAKAYDWACYKVLGDASGPNLGPLTETEKGGTRTLEEILVQDCGRRTDTRYSKKPDALSKYKGVSFDKRSQTWRARLSVDGKEQYFGYYDTEVQAAKASDWACYKVLGDASGPNLGPLTEAEKSDTRTLQEILVQDCRRRRGKRHLPAEAAAAEGGAGAEPSGDESDAAVDELPSSDEKAEAEIMREGKRQRRSASPFPSPPTVPLGAKRSRTGWTSVTPPTRATARPRSTTPPPPRLDTRWLDGSLTVATPALSDEPVFLGAYPDLQERFSISERALEQLTSLQRKLQAPPGQIVLELPPELSAQRKAITQARSMLFVELAKSHPLSQEALLFARDGPGKDGALQRTLQLVEPFLLEAGHVAGGGGWGLRTPADVTVPAGRVLAVYWGDYRTGDELDELQEQELRPRRARQGPRLRPLVVLSHLLDLDSPFETDLVVDAAPFVSDTCRMKTVAGLINHHSGIADRPNVCFVHAVRGAGFEPLPRMKLPLCFLVALEDIPPSTEAVVDYETGSESYLAVLEQLHQRARQVKLEESAAGAAALL